MSIVENIQTQLDDDKYSAGVFVDLKKAFDNVDHNILLEKLDYSDVRNCKGMLCIIPKKAGNNLFQLVVISQVLK